MSTRRLIIAALLCGLAILGAGTFLLVGLLGADDEGTPPAEVGQLVDVGGATVGVLGARRDGDVVVLSLSLEAPPEAIGALAASWNLLDPTGPTSLPDAAVPEGATACPADGAGEPTAAALRCDVAFDATELAGDGADLLAVFDGDGGSRFWSVAVAGT